MQQNATPPRMMLRLFTALHVWLYRISDGKLWHTRNDLPVLLLTTTGRSSDKLHTTPLVYLEDGEHFVIMPGVFERPDWYLNLIANPTATVQIKNQQFAVQAIEAQGEVRTRLWESVPQYWRDYQAQYANSLPLMTLHRSDNDNS